MVKRIRKNSNFIFIAFIILILYKGIENYKWFFDNCDHLFSILIPFFWGFGIAYILNPMLLRLENKYKLKRFPAMIICYLVFFGFIGLFITIVTPIILQNLFDIVKYLPDYMNALQSWFDNTLLTFPLIEKLNLVDYIKTNISGISTMIFEFLNLTINGVLTKVIGVTSGLLKFIVGIIVSVYILNEKESFANSSKKFIKSMFGEMKSKKIISFFQLCNGVLLNFFIGKAIDSFIIGIIAFIGFSLMKAPYALLLSLIVGITNMIPYFGPFIGAFPAILITLFVSPIKAFWVAVFILVLQQVDGNIIGPKILGEKVGISPFYIILSILIGGGFFGMLGMLFAVPLFKIISILLNNYMDYRLEKQSDIVSSNEE